MRRAVLIPYFLFLAAFGAALAGLNPTFFADDSAETVTAGVLLGIPHPPGYPLHTMLTRLACHLPLSQVPYRGNLLSALLAAAVVSLLYRLLRSVWDLKHALAAGCALLWIAGATTYPAALSAKGGIYHLTALLLGGMLFQEDSRVKRKIPLLGDLPLVGGLFQHNQRSAGNSELLIFVTPEVIDAPTDMRPAVQKELDDARRKLHDIREQMGPPADPNAAAAASEGETPVAAKEEGQDVVSK